MATRGYRTAVKQAIADRRGQALVIETVRPIGADGLPTELRGLVTFGPVPMFLTRLTTVLDASSLTQDAPLDGIAPEGAPSMIILSSARPAAAPLFATVLLGTMTLLRRRGRREGGRRSGRIR